jgi:A/G-specific adenine glycosylase
LTTDPNPTAAAIVAWWTENARELPWRETRDVYAVWVAEVMSAQTTIGRVVPAWVRWMARWPTVEALADASLREVLREWQGLGYPRRARDLHRSAQLIISSGWPKELTQLPGVGAYTAAAVRCFALEEPVLPRDVNVTRVLERRFPHGLDISADPWRTAQAIMEFGQRICAARPRCDVCPVSGGCPGPGGTRVARPRQKRFEGSQRQRRGRLLREVVLAGVAMVEGADQEAALGLAADGLAVLSGDQLRGPSPNRVLWGQRLGPRRWVLRSSSKTFDV